MAQILYGNKAKTDDGKIVDLQEGGWVGTQQAWRDPSGNWTLSDPGTINKYSNQVGAGKAVSKEVLVQTNPNNVAYVDQARQKAGLSPSPSVAAPINDTSNPAFGATTGSNGVAQPLGVIDPVSPTINLPELYKQYYDQAGISDLEKQLSDNVTSYNDAQSKINDDPFLSEANRVGRSQKLSTDFDNRIANLKNDIATKKADVETKLALDQKQFDINSQSAQQEFSKFQNLLSMGALDNASGEAIASITRATGLTSDMIRAAIQANKAKNVQTQLIQYDDGQNQGFAVINPQTGEIIKQQTVAASTKGATGGGSSLLNESRQFELDQKQAPALAAQAAKSGKTLKDMLSFYSQWLDPQTIYQIYNTNSIYGPAKEDKKTLAALGIKK